MSKKLRYSEKKRQRACSCKQNVLTLQRDSKRTQDEQILFHRREDFSSSTDVQQDLKQNGMIMKRLILLGLLAVFSIQSFAQVNKTA